ncbi:metallophosphoesterase 1 homolog isoform X2 [Stomoxys calcitrans]|uniref:Calcineurin-like phosphoesterase domain-containing protein n=1 Tax=Stomoxys calcitrans TaxID=35570 RepID=A0A1I8QBH9_STOCA|nr:metallophosphoesterase 1 homolog isoform X2 [Stomoxys calcitrans]
MPIRHVYRWIIRTFLLLTLLLCCYNEILVYRFNRSSWQEINCHYENCTRILFIADPQLLGETNDKSFHSGLARYDSDRYLHRTFQQALIFTQPHIICFLGDLLDEGNVASPHEFQNYVKRFRYIYQTETDIRLVHVPGDNDIGGENGEYISNLNIHRFEEAFTRRDIFDYEANLRFFKINRMMLDFTNPDKTHNHQKLRIGLSHAPLLIGGGPLLRSVISELDPHVIFSGHWHESRIFIYPSTKVINFYDRSVKHFNLKELKEKQHSFLEIMVPTSSYRMGKVHIGIGYGVLENYDLRYTVLWLPNRFVYLFIYLFWLIFSFSIILVCRMMYRCPFRKISKRQTQYQRISDGIPD